jgi:hypothetical protein
VLNLRIVKVEVNYKRTVEEPGEVMLCKYNDELVCESTLCEEDGSQPGNCAMLEALAALEHDQWNNVLKYLQSKGLDPKVFNPSDWARWMRQMQTPYAELSEKEKESDRVWDRKALALFKEP